MSPPNSQSGSEELPLSPLSLASPGDADLHGSGPRSGGKEESGFLSYLFRGHPIPQTRNTGSNSLNRHRAVLVGSSPQSRKQAVDTTDQTRNHTYDPAGAGSFAMETLSEKEEVETQLIMTLLHSYFNIVRKNLMDSVPKAIMHFLVNHVVEQLPTRLVSDLYKEELFTELLQEDEAVLKQRARCKTALEAYRQAATILAELRDTDVSRF